MIEQAVALIKERGVEHRSLREVARRLNVSHQAPQKHFPSRDHSLAAVVDRCFAGFAQHLSARPPHDDPYEDLYQMGLAYLALAQSYPFLCQLMFNTALPDGAAHPDMLAQAQVAILQDRRGGVTLKDLDHPIADPVSHDAMYIWSALHELASLLQSDVTGTLGLTDDAKAIAVERLMRCMSLSIAP
ncbi:TetR/AcrR family transcriptional regulator [Jannaschia sp. CCS1]|uniref:TetR/AcrR family transcriptional regulator n=1 Tax=Jannaschia sp. (strain CCS1) TaxID=290400 RepID=UPI00140FECEE|nr:TetR/AcrR family transcriptional regulator [Jannaschia sp. CCS1]